MCPWNAKFAVDATEPAFTPRPELVAPDLAVFATMDDAEFKARFGDTPLSRAKLRGLQRNAVALLHNAASTADGSFAPRTVPSGGNSQSER